MNLKTFLENFNPIAQSPNGIAKLRSPYSSLMKKKEMIIMTMRDTIITKLHNLPESTLQQVSDFIDLISQGSKDQNGDVNYEKRVAEVEKILKETKGSWGNLSLDEIDARLTEQRKFDWGE